MTEYVSVDQVIRLNKALGGACRDQEGLEAAIGRASQTFLGDDLHQTIWMKAATLLHGIASTQTFVDGNKRTSWVATKYFLELNGETFKNIPQIARESFVLTVATGLFSPEQVASWLEEYSLRARDRIEYALLCENIAFPKVGGLVTAIGLGAHGGTLDSVPAKTQLVLVSKVQWHRIDAGQNRTTSVRIREEFRPWVELDESSPYVSTTSLIPPPVENHLYPTGMMPSYLNFGLPLTVYGPKEFEVELLIDGEVAHAIPCTLHVMPKLPDWDAFPMR